MYFFNLASITRLNNSEDPNQTFPRPPVTLKMEPAEGVEPPTY